MTKPEISPDHVIGNLTSLRSLYGEVRGVAGEKVIGTLDPHARDFIRRAPFLCLGTRDASGKSDVSPRGDPPGFVRVLDDTTLAIPDRPGNNRLDSLENILSDPHVGVLFIVPGFDETLRVNGTAQLVTDPEVLGPMAVNGRVPTLAILVTVTSVFFHCAKAFRRSRLWDVDAQQDRSEMPSLLAMVREQTTGAKVTSEEDRDLRAAIEESYRRSMY
ncbi:hypothetical protein JANAI62_13840 [Jannaschia pagri]|uniref:Pyridoxamine 5'-phosphate oxidase N-terminal domain-containing protein n=1 Tax=Jannaschia pagri TaxID=2829797 RepID=A0ABQ4NK10_9RHOB|nr:MULTISPECIES: pyridoxamine 5'-phosphate oxidase family protein [unclassified Jannaschia]GIT90930.1 hypothetical protein JANAI61_13880 [Jannaschia sp. AI_61]GIT94761.1 hypothetical protein JANAI62_13840 [Jannaschia sp. AI_62]